MERANSGSLKIRASNQGLYIEGENIPSDLVCLVVDSHLADQRQRREAKFNSRWQNILQSAFGLILLIMVLGFVGQVAGCGQNSPYAQEKTHAN